MIFFGRVGLTATVSKIPELLGEASPNRLVEVLQSDALAMFAQLVLGEHRFTHNNPDCGVERQPSLLEIGEFRVE